MYLILCWSYLNHSLRFVGKKIRIKKKNRILNRNRNIWGKNRNSIISPNRSALLPNATASRGLLPITHLCPKPRSAEAALTDGLRLRQTGVDLQQRAHTLTFCSRVCVFVCVWLGCVICVIVCGCVSSE